MQALELKQLTIEELERLEKAVERILGDDPMDARMDWFEVFKMGENIRAELARRRCKPLAL